MHGKQCQAEITLHLFKHSQRVIFHQGVQEFQGVSQTGKKVQKCEIKRAKLSYKQKVVYKLANKSLGSAWDSVRTKVGLNNKVKKKVALKGFSSNLALAQEFNMFYSRFDVHNFINKTAVLKHNLLNSSHSVSSISVHSAVNIFKNCKARTSTGPDNISSHLLLI